MSDNLILQELYKNELELVRKLEATRNAIIGFGGNIKESSLHEINDNNEIPSIKKKEKESSLISTYNSDWNWENKIIYTLKYLGEGNVDQIADFIFNMEPNLNKKTVRNSIGVRASKMKKAKLLKYKLSEERNRRHKHIYYLP